MSKRNILVHSIYTHDEEHVPKQASELGALVIFRKQALDEALVSTITSVLDPATG